MDEETRIQIIRINNDIRRLQLDREKLLSESDLTTKEHMEFYQGMPLTLENVFENTKPGQG